LLALALKNQFAAVQRKITLPTPPAFEDQLARVRNEAFLLCGFVRGLRREESDNNDKNEKRSFYSFTHAAMYRITTPRSRADSSDNSSARVCIARVRTQSGPGNFCKAKANKRPVAANGRPSFGRSRSDSMKSTLLLTNEAETTRLMLKNVAFDELAARNTETHAGCNCDRWGHPCPGCIDRDIVPRAKTPVSSPVKQ
jgi:hypothetical protein